MQKLHTSIFINASLKKVWHTMLDDAPYREWTKAFNPGSYYKGSWDEGSDIQFLGPSESGEGEDGMLSRIKENRPYEFISIEHIGLIKNGKVDTLSEEVKKWIPAFENYTFIEKNDGTELTVEMDIDEAYKEMFDEMWAKALQTLKELAEK